MVSVMDENPERDRAVQSQRRQRMKNWALFAALVAFVVVVYFVSIVKMSGG